MDNLDQTKRELMDEVKGKLIEELNLEEITPEDIDNEAPLFGDEGLGLDSIEGQDLRRQTEGLHCQYLPE